MGGTKKRSITSEEKAQAKGAEEQAAKAKSEKKGGRSPKHEEYKDRVRDEKEALNQLKTAKSLTLYSVAKALGVTASASNQFLRTLESKGLIVKVGGFSSHFIYKFKE
jgi:ribosomal protein S25